MSVETAGKVYNWDPGNNSVTIKKFKNAAALREYLEVGTVQSSSKSAMGGVSASVNMAVGVPSYDASDASSYEFVLKKIGGLPITVIESNAFAPDPNGDGSDDISSVVKTIVLPDTITTLGTNVFADVGAEIVVDIPPVVVEAVTGQSAESAANSGALEGILGGDVVIAVKDESNPVPVTTIPAANPSLESVTSTWINDGTTLTVTLTYTKAVNSVTLMPDYTASWDAFTPNSGRTIWTSTYKGGTNMETWYVPIRAATSYNGGSKTATKDVSLVNGSLAREGGAGTYQIIGYFNGPDNTRIAGLKKTTDAATVWKTIPTGDIRNIFEAIYVPNAPGTKDVFVQGADVGKTAVTFTSGISKAALQLFHVTIGSNSDGDGIKIQRTALPTASGESYTASPTNLIIIDVGQSSSSANNSGLPVFRIPNQGLGAQNGEYGHIRLRVNKGARMVIVADNSAYDAGGAGHPCPNGYFNDGCVEVMAGGELRDGAYEGFPLGADAVILNRNGSYLAVGSEGVDNGPLYKGWLIGPNGSGDNAPRIVWDSGNSANKYIEVRPGQLAIDANVDVKQILGLIYDVFFLDSTKVILDTAADTRRSFDAETGSIIVGLGGSISSTAEYGSLSGLAVNIAGTNGAINNYRFYAETDKVSIILKPSTTTNGNGIMKYALGGTLTEAKGFIIAGTNAPAEGIVIKGTLGTGSSDSTYGEYSDTGISEYNKWLLPPTWTIPAGTLSSAQTSE
jgi:hypothetical protein